jgi:molybdate transport system ATP-binding protein
LDEPCQGLDNQQSARFVLLIDGIYSGSNKTLIYVSHDETSIPSCIERILELQKETPVIQTIGSATLAAAS